LEGLKLRIDADLSDAEKAIDDFAKSAEKSGKRAADGLSQPLANVPAAIDKVNASLKKLPETSNGATQSLINLGRVVQDAPFGFLGIANNLNPLVEGFSRLRTSAGSTGSAFKALGASLLGAGGLSLGISFVSSALIVFGDKLFGSSKRAKEAQDAIDALGKNVSDNAAKLTSLVGIVQNVNASLENKKLALQAINQEYQPYLKNLGEEKVTLENVGKAYDVIIQSLIRQAAVKGLQDQISEAVKKTAAEIVNLRIEQKKRDEDLKNQGKTVEDQKTKYQQAGQAVTQFNKPVRDGILAQKDAQTEYKITADKAFDLGEKEKQLTEQLKKQLSPLLDITTSFEDLGIKLNKVGTKKAKKDFDELDAILKILAIDEQILLRDLKPISDEFLRGAQNAKKIFADIQLDPLATDFGPKFQRISQDIQTEVSRLTQTNPILIKANTRVDLTTEQQALKDAIEEINRVIKDTAIQGLSNIGELIGQALSGGDLSKVFANFGEIIGSGIQEIGKQLIQFGVAAKLAKLALSKFNPTLAIAAGLALVGLGAVIKSKLGKGVPGLAEGGLATGPTLALVGEGIGTSRSNPEVIAPLDKLKGLIGTGAPQLLMARIRGNDILLSNDRTTRQNRRLGRGL
jgi:hypothetical protein